MLRRTQAMTERKSLVGASILALAVACLGMTSAAHADRNNNDWSDWSDWGDRNDRGHRKHPFELTDDGYIHGCVGKTGKVKLVNSAEDCKKKETYVYWNQKNTSVGVKNIDGETSTYTINNGRYHVEATKAFEGTTVPLDMDIVRELCQDSDGCTVTISMRGWDPDQPGNVASRGPAKLFMSQTSNWWRISPAVSVSEAKGNDGDGVMTHVMRAYSCYLTEGEYIDYTNTDDTVGFGLLNWQWDSEPNMVCALDIDD